MLHQLDFKTSGLMIYSLNSKKLASYISKMFESREITKSYQATLNNITPQLLQRLRAEIEKGRELDITTVTKAYEQDCKSRCKSAKKRKKSTSSITAPSKITEGGGGHEEEEVNPDAIPEIPVWCTREYIGIFKHGRGGKGGEGKGEGDDCKEVFYISCPVKEDCNGICTYFHSLLTKNVEVEEKVVEKVLKERWLEGCKGGKHGWKLAITRVEIVKVDEEEVRVNMEPITGRRHQLRLHVKALGGWIKGDDVYMEKEEGGEGEGEGGGERMYLNAYKIAVKEYDKVTVREWRGVDMFEEIDGE
ncbi:hypothetical protein TrCOL_g6049 [Triparma columacea]|uniref:Pseudouridine synthase RsuA/RluA-like domain-containing protein n=1 Tax=Triparma columacea TaxID=722753 RepID=A0A9W7LBE5_9STRA|nr:hypothetical protein TrCOL_g6049 [Triparma columacea]